MISQLLYRRLLKSQDRTWLEITPPANIAKTPDATEQLFSVLHGMYGTRKLSDKVLGRLPVLSFEIVSTKKDGIRFLILVESSYSDAIQKAIMAYIPEAKVRECNIEIPSADRVLEFRQKGHYVLPLTLVSAMDQHDPLAYVTNAMSNLAADESISVQLIVSPIKLREARRLSRRIMSNEDILSDVGNKGFAVMNGISNALNSVLWGAVDMTSEVYHGTTSGVYTTYADDGDRKFKAQVNKRQRPARTLSAFELELMESMHTKVTQSLFQVSLRVMVSGSRSKIHLRTLRSALEAYSVPLYQSLKVKAKLPFDASRWKRMADKRLPVLFRKDSLILSASELSSL
ncbi:MAG: hypothetical protein K2X29_02125, partial [Candidatus Obscuribacterales bacterium]|nr:hypothetical protein [Candidatus Obscuribacterales bacterium]